jgi:gallate decarboxylase subunit D
MFRWTAQHSRVRLDFTAFSMGNDLCVLITGGDRPHLGAVGIAQVRPSTHDRDKLTSSTSVLTLFGHKEDGVVYKAAPALATKLNKNVVVCCGIHVDNITPEEMKFVTDAVEKFCSTFPPAGVIQESWSPLSAAPTAEPIRAV